MVFVAPTQSARVSTTSSVPDATCVDVRMGRPGSHFQKIPIPIRLPLKSAVELEFVTGSLAFAHAGKALVGQHVK